MKNSEIDEMQIDLVISKAIFDIQHFHQSNKVNQQEYQIFMQPTSELRLEPYGKTCYLQAVLLAFNQVKRFVMSIMLHANIDEMGLLKAAIQEFLAKSRRNPD